MITVALDTHSLLQEDTQYVYIILYKNYHLILNYLS